MTADQYKVVHQHLFAAIVEVLGDAVTPEVADAWDQLYWDMADLLIASESDLYAAAGVEPGQVWREVRVTDRVQVSPDTIALTVAAVDRRRPPGGSGPDSTSRCRSR